MSKTKNRTATRGRSAQPKPQRHTQRPADTYDQYGYRPTPDPATLAPGEYRRHMALLNSMVMPDGIVADLLSRYRLTEADGWSSADATWDERFQGYATVPGPGGSDVLLHMSHAATALTHPTLGAREVTSVLYARVGLDDTAFAVTYPQDIPTEHANALHDLAMTALTTTREGRIAEDVPGYVWLRYPEHRTFANSADDADWREWDVADADAPSFPVLAGFTA